MINLVVMFDSNVDKHLIADLIVNLLSDSIIEISSLTFRLANDNLRNSGKFAIMNNNFSISS